MGIIQSRRAPRASKMILSGLSMSPTLQEVITVSALALVKGTKKLPMAAVDANRIKKGCPV